MRHDPQCFQKRFDERRGENYVCPNNGIKGMWIKIVAIVGLAALNIF
jgi:hypothetical protein